MTRWKWKGALSLLLAGAGVGGLAWSQAPATAQRPAAKQPDRIMTVHEENGQAIRCRVLQSWRLATGSMAHQLQALDDGEMLTIVQDGPPTSKAAGAGQQVRALPMKIYHWGQQTRPPAGSPEPPLLAQPTWSKPAAVARPQQQPRVEIQPVAAQHVPQQAASQHIAPQYVAPQYAAPQYAAPQYVAQQPPQPAAQQIRSRPMPAPTASPNVVRSAPVPAAIVQQTPVPNITIEAMPAHRQPIQQVGQHQFRPAWRSAPAQSAPMQSAPVSAPVTSTSDCTPAAHSGIRVIEGGVTEGGVTECRERLISWEVPGSRPAQASRTPVIINGAACADDCSVAASKGAGKGAGPGNVSTVAGSERLVLLSEETRNSKGQVVARPTTQTIVIPEPSPRHTVSTRPALATKAIAPVIHNAAPPSAAPSVAPSSAVTQVAHAGHKAGQPVNAAAAVTVAVTRQPATNPAVCVPTTVCPPATAMCEPVCEPRPAWDNSKLHKEPSLASRVVQRRDDVLLNPEKVNPIGTGLPKVPAEVVASLPSPLNQSRASTPEHLPVAGARNNAALRPRTPATLPPLPTQPPANSAAYQLPSNVPQPLGIQSVLAARGGAQGPVTYIPVPVATVPEPVRAPVPPDPQVPAPPNPTAYVNAFTPPPPQGQQQQPNQMLPQQLPPHTGMHPMMPMQPMHPGYGPRQPARQMATLIPTMPGMRPLHVAYPASYTGPQPPNPFGPQQQMPMQQVPMQQMPVQQPAQQMPMQQMPVHPYMMQQGPMQQQHPMQQYPVQPYGYTPAMGQPLQPVSYAVQAMDRPYAAVPTAEESAKLSQLIQVLQESPYPAQREWAATNLSSFDWRVYPHLTQVLIQSARQDATATVRAAAVYSLARMNAQTEAVVATLQALRGDADPRVRQEVEQACARMGLARQQQPAAQQQPGKQ